MAGIRYLASVPKFNVEIPTIAENNKEKNIQRKINGSLKMNLIVLKNPVLKMTYRVNNKITRLSREEKSMITLLDSQRKGLYNAAVMPAGILEIKALSVGSKAPIEKTDPASDPSVLR